MGQYTKAVVRNIKNLRDYAKEITALVNEYMVQPIKRLTISKEVYEDGMLIGYVYTLVRYTPASDNGKLRGQLVGVLNVFGVQCISAILDQTELITSERGEIDRSLVLEMAKKADISRVRGKVRKVRASFTDEGRFRIAHERASKFAAFVTQNLMEGALLGESADSLRHRLRNIDLLWEKFRSAG